MYESFSKWGGERGSNPRVPEPQSGVLTTSPPPPYVALAPIYNTVFIHICKDFFYIFTIFH